MNDVVAANEDLFGQTNEAMEENTAMNVTLTLTLIGGYGGEYSHERKDRSSHVRV